MSDCLDEAAAENFMEESVFPDNDRFRKLLLACPPKAIQFLYAFYYAGLVAMAERLTHDKMLAEDVVQEAFVGIWVEHEWLGRQQGKSIHHYLIRVVRNRAITAFKKQRRMRERHIACLHGWQNSSVTSAEDTLVLAEIRSQVHRLIHSFPRREKECFLLSREEEMSNKQIAESLRISEKAVERSITSARKRIRSLFELIVSGVVL